MLYAAELINPEHLSEYRERGYLITQRSIECDCCKINYTDEHYKILFDNKKIGYFYVASGDKTARLSQLCHACIFKKIKKEVGDEEVDLVIIDEENEYHVKFYPEDGEPNGDDFLNGDAF
tara:strand:- start:175 stop:534 length:360 start_codon:yes stop_codon:yes gene_type:complete